MAARRNSAFNGRSNRAAWRSQAYAAINIEWKKICPDGDRDERLAWVAEFLGLKELGSLTDLSDQQLGAVAGGMKRLTGYQVQAPSPARDRQGTVVQGNFGRDTESSDNVDRGAVFLASPEQIYTLDKLQTYLGWSNNDVFEFIKKRVLRGKARSSGTVPSFRMLTFKQATTAVNALLHTAGHRDLKRRSGGRPVSRVEVDKYIPMLKHELKIDQIPQGKAVRNAE